MTKEDLVGEFEQDSDIYDKISTIMIRFDEDSDIEDTYLKSLQTIFKKETTRQEKIDAFEVQGIEIDDQLESGVSDMCNYGSYVANSSRKEGRIEGAIECLDMKLLKNLLHSKNKLWLKSVKKIWNMKY